MMKKIKALSLIGLVILIFSCSKDDLVNQLLLIPYPSSFPASIYKFENNLPTNNGFNLGKKLFYDPGLSIDGTVSCGTCHQQFAGFSNLDHTTSHGINNCFGERNSPVLFNLIWKDNLFLDGGVKNLEVAPLNALTNTCEMGNDISKILVYLKSKTEYQTAFKSAFEGEEITSQKMLWALAQFTGMMISAESKYDQVKAGKDTFSASENSGYTLFKQKCASCHQEPLFTDNSFRNNGLDITSLDLGRANITSIKSDEGKFKVPTLRNIEFSRPYMHDGRYSSLETVLNHYQNGIKMNENLDPMLYTNLDLSAQNKVDIIAFLKTLTDYKFLKNPIFNEN